MDETFALRLAVRDLEARLRDFEGIDDIDNVVAEMQKLRHEVKTKSDSEQRLVKSIKQLLNEREDHQRLVDESSEKFEELQSQVSKRIVTITSAVSHCFKFPSSLCVVALTYIHSHPLFP